MKVLVVGSGGREHALCWKIAQSDRVSKLYCAPGNGGIRDVAELVDIKADDVKSLVSFACENAIDLTVIGPEAPLVDGIVDKFQAKGLRVFGPTKEPSRLEGSKIFSKEMMKKCGVPTAAFEIFTDAGEALKHAGERKLPFVVKADGLAAGKGVVVCQAREEAEAAIKSMLVDKKFGASGEQIIIEDCLEGEEASIIVISDGVNVLPLASSQDHKRIFDNDRGPNTGGMGAYSPAPIISVDIEERIMREVIHPMIKGMADNGMPYTGVLYAGIMVTTDGPMVLEFNVRLGDPETQAILPRLKNDIVTLMECAIDGTLNDKSIIWDRQACVCVVLASAGYPGAYKKGRPITGLDKAGEREGVTVFHAGTSLNKGLKGESVVTSGGRVLGVTALGLTIADAIKSAYTAVSDIQFEGVCYRKDIGRRALARQAAT